MYTYMYILKGLRPMSPTRTLKASRPTDRLQVTSEGPQNQQRDQSIVRAHSVQTIGVLGEVLEGSQGVPWGLQELWGFSGVCLGSLGSQCPRGVLGKSSRGPGGSLGVPGESLGGP